MKILKQLMLFTALISGIYVADVRPAFSTSASSGFNTQRALVDTSQPGGGGAATLQVSYPEMAVTTANELTHAGGYRLEVIYAVPYDAGSAGRDADGCGKFSMFPDSGPCLSQGIDTLDMRRVHFHKYPVSVDRYRHQCSFATDPGSFSLSMLARENPSAKLTAWQQKEIVIKVWPQNTNNLPIKAFFYFLTDTRATGFVGAQNIQRDFFEQTLRINPIIRVTPSVITGNVFSYQQEDQAL